MNSIGWFLSGVGCVAGALAFPPAGIPLLVGGVVCGIVAEQQRKEEEVWQPIVELERDALIDLAEQEIGYWAVEQDWLLETQHNHNIGQSIALLQTLEAKLSGQLEGHPKQPQTQQQMKSAAPTQPNPDQEPTNPAQPAQVTAIEQVQPVGQLAGQLAGHDLPEDPWAGAEYVPVNNEPPLLNLQALMKVSFLLIWGTQGGRKTTLAKAIARMRHANGHAVTVADPHGAKAHWAPFKVIGSGRKYDQLNEFLSDYDDDMTADYERYAVGKTDFPYRTLLVDEFTQWADKCPNAPAFVKSICSDIRKVNRCVIMVSHSRTLTGLGDAKGLRDAIDRSAVQIELETVVNESDGEYEATSYGWLSYPGMERRRVKIPNLPHPSQDASKLNDADSTQTENPTIQN
jgi:hypothetical protein